MQHSTMLIKNWRTFTQRLVLGFFGLILSTLTIQAQIVRGTVFSDEGSPLTGATIRILGETTGVFSDENGAYQISASPEAILEFSFIGFESKSVQVGDQTEIDIVLITSQSYLDEVVVVGYGTSKKSDLTGAVSSISAEELTQIATPDVLQALQGRAAGVNVTSQSGAPGAGVRIRIRGVGSINNSDPLYVVDGFQTSDISFLNPNDIESIEVLKDASATAIYGSRGANGVVLITTKRGHPGKTTIEFNGYVANQEVWRTLDLLDATEFAQLRLEAYANDGISPGDPETSIERNVLEYVAAGDYAGTDWQDEVLRTGFMQFASMNIAGGGERNRFSISGTYYDEEGTIKNTGMRKIFVRSTTDNQITDWLNLNSSVAYVNVNQTFYNQDYFNGMLPTAIRANPIRPAFDQETGNWGTLGIPQEGSNAARIVDENKNNRGATNKVVGNFGLAADITKSLTFRSIGALDFTAVRNKSFIPAFFITNEEQRDQSRLSEVRQEGFRYQVSNFLTYDQSFGNNNLAVMLGQEIQGRSFSNVQVQGFDLPDDPNQYFLSAARDPEFIVNSSQQTERLASFFSRINYTYGDRYLLTVNMRYDGSSRFTPENRWGFFPSVSAGWNLGREEFLQSVDAIGDLKLRAGWGQVGNQNAAINYGYVTTVVGNQLYVFNGQEVQGFIPTTLSNPDLIWETSTMTNVGIDATFFDDKFLLTADYFIRQTSDMIGADVIPAFAGAFPARVNVGSMENRGLEMGLTYRNYEREFKYDLTFNFTAIQNEVTRLGKDEEDFIDGGSAARAGNTTRTIIGQPIASFFGLQTDGIFNDQAEIEAHNFDGGLIQPNASPGDVKFVDQLTVDTDGDGVPDAPDGVINDEDRVFLGDGFADFTFGFNGTASYKGFDLNLFLQGSYGNEVVFGLYQPFHAALGYNNTTVDYFNNRWTPENPDATQPRATIQDPNDNDRFSDLYIQDGSYLRVKNVQLGYTLPNRILGDSKVRFYVAGDNLLTFTNYEGLDPEIGELFGGNPFSFGVDVANYPQPRRLRFGVDLRF